MDSEKKVISNDNIDLLESNLSSNTENADSALTATINTGQTKRVP